MSQPTKTTSTPSPADDRKVGGMEKNGGAYATRTQAEHEKSAATKPGSTFDRGIEKIVDQH
jgi:hypothetical protein